VITHLRKRKWGGREGGREKKLRVELECNRVDKLEKMSLFPFTFA
jgi:hypothetical protein